MANYTVSVLDDGITITLGSETMQQIRNAAVSAGLETADFLAARIDNSITELQEHLYDQAKEVIGTLYLAAEPEVRLQVDVLLQPKPLESVPEPPA